MWLLIVAVIAFLVIKHRHDKNSNLLELQRIVLVDSPDSLIIAESQLMNAATVQAQNDMRIIKDCTSLVSSTTKPDVFFSRLELLLKTSRHLMLFEPYLPFKGASPSAAYNILLSGFSSALFSNILLINPIFLNQKNNKVLVELFQKLIGVKGTKSPW